MSRAFAGDPLKQRQWEAFLQDVAVRPPGSLADVLDELVDFLMPAATEARAFSKKNKGG